MEQHTLARWWMKKRALVRAELNDYRLPRRSAERVSMTALRALLLVLLASVAMGCGDPVGPCPIGGEDCLLPDLTGNWEVMLTPPMPPRHNQVVGGGSCQIGPIELRLEKFEVQRGVGAGAVQVYGGEHTAIDGTCDEAGWAALGMAGPGRLLSAGAIRGTLAWSSVSSSFSALLISRELINSL